MSCDLHVSLPKIQAFFYLSLRPCTIALAVTVRSSDKPFRTLEGAAIWRGIEAMAGDAEPPDADDDDISLTSTAPSEELSEYEVSEILAERDDEDGKLYLVDWKGYPRHRATWEPPENFQSEETLQQWEQKLKAIGEGKEQPFDIEAWEAEKERVQLATAERRSRRQAKRQRLIRAGFDLRPLHRSSDDSNERRSLEKSLDDVTAGRDFYGRRRSEVGISVSSNNVSPAVGVGLHPKNTGVSTVISVKMHNNSLA